MIDKPNKVIAMQAGFLFSKLQLEGKYLFVGNESLVIGIRICQNNYL